MSNDSFFITNSEVYLMSGGTAERKGDFGYYKIGREVLYFNRKPTEKDIQEALKKAEAGAENPLFAKINCDGACCADQPSIIN